VVRGSLIEAADPAAGTRDGPSHVADTLDPLAPMLLVATYFGEGWTTGGAVIVDSLLRRYPADRYVRFSVPLRSSGAAQGPSAARCAHAFHAPGLLHPRWRGSASRLLWYAGSYVQARQAAALARAASADLVWSVLDYTWVPFTYRFMRRSRLPVHVSVHDDPVVSARLAGWPPDVLARLAQAFEFCYKRAASRDVISDSMRRHYSATYDRDAVIVTHGIPSAHATLVARANVAHRPLRIVHLGNLHYADEAIRFTEALKGEAEVTFIGNPPAQLREAAVRMPLRVLPWMSPEALDSELARYDFAYLPYGFAPDRRLFVETSFPTKFISYLKAGLPVIHHAPSYSSVAAFMRSYGVGVLVDSLDARAIRAALNSIEPTQHAAMRVECARAAREVFDERVVFDRWFGAVRRAMASPLGDPHGRA
jgi:hypothetical protein